MKLIDKLLAKKIQKQLDQAGIEGIDPESITPDKLQKLKALADKVMKSDPELAEIFKSKEPDMVKIMANRRKIEKAMKQYQDEIQEILS